MGRPHDQLTRLGLRGTDPRLMPSRGPARALQSPERSAWCRRQLPRSLEDSRERCARDRITPVRSRNTTRISTPTLCTSRSEPSYSAWPTGRHGPAGRRTEAPSGAAAEETPSVPAASASVTPAKRQIEPVRSGRSRAGRARQERGAAGEDSDRCQQPGPSERPSQPHGDAMAGVSPGPSAVDHVAEEHSCRHQGEADNVALALVEHGDHRPRHGPCESPDRWAVRAPAPCGRAFAVGGPRLAGALVDRFWWRPSSATSTPRTP